MTDSTWVSGKIVRLEAPDEHLKTPADRILPTSGTKKVCSWPPTCGALRSGERLRSNVRAFSRAALRQFDSNHIAGIARGESSFFLD